jgi:hypothetical protein
VDPRVRDLLMGAVALLVVVLFCLFTGWVEYEAVSATSPVVVPGGVAVLWGILTGFVGGFVASSFGIPSIAGHATAKRHLHRIASSVERRWAFCETTGRHLIGYSYIVAYFAGGLVAIVVVLVRWNVSPDALKAFAGAALGILIVLGRSFTGAIWGDHYEEPAE